MLFCYNSNQQLYFHFFLTGVEIYSITKCAYICIIFIFADV